MEILAVVLSIALYILVVLLPIVPALIIYQRFPTTPTQVKGPLGGLGINVSGAMAAYVLAAVLAYMVAVKTQALIGSLVTSTWDISGEVQLEGTDNKMIRDAKLFDRIRCDIPDVLNVQGGIFQWKLPARGEAPPDYAVTFRVEGFGFTNINLAKHMQSHNDSAKTIELKPVVVAQDASPYNPAPSTGPKPVPVTDKIVIADTAPEKNQ